MKIQENQVTEIPGREGNPCPGGCKVDTPLQKWRKDYEVGRGDNLFNM